MKGNQAPGPQSFQVECMLKKIRLFLDIHKERRIVALQKYEAVLRDKLQSTKKLELKDVKEDLQLCVINYQKVRAMAIVGRYVSFLEDKSLLISQAYQNPSILKELLPIMQGIGWALYKLNSDLAPEYLSFFRPLIGDVTKLDRFVERQLYYLLAWIVPQDIECIKYLRGFLDRNNIPVEKVNHYGWFGTDIDTHIKKLETEEINKSKMRSTMRPPPPPPSNEGPSGGQPPYNPPSGPSGPGVKPTVGPSYQEGQYTFTFGPGGPNAQPVLPPTPPAYQPPTNPTPSPFGQAGDFGGYHTSAHGGANATGQSTAQPPAVPLFPPAPLNECTQAELGIEIGEKYNDDFEKDLALLKKDLQIAEADQKTSEIFHETKRREALNPADAEKAFLAALMSLKDSTNADATAQDGIKHTTQEGNPFDEPPKQNFADPFIPGANTSKTASVFLPGTPAHQPEQPKESIVVAVSGKNLDYQPPVQPPAQPPVQPQQNPAGGVANPFGNYSNTAGIAGATPNHTGVGIPMSFPSAINQQTGGVDQRIPHFKPTPQHTRISDRDFIALMKRVGV